MALFTIGDLHLSLGTDKPMDVFGGRWINYIEKIAENWIDCVKHDDTVVLCGDISWAMYLEECFTDFDFLHKLPGKKIILKGNHDYWWSTMSKMEQYVAQHGFHSIHFLQNNSYIYNGYGICGTRGWINSPSTDEDVKIFAREVERLKLSIEHAKKSGAGEIMVFLHYPPLDSGLELLPEYGEIFEKSGVIMCAYGHIHANHSKSSVNGMLGGVDFRLVSCDYINFNPMQLL